MSIKTTTCHYIRCDYPDCRTEVESDDGGELHYASADQVRVAAQDDEWLVDAEGRDYCMEHWTMNGDGDHVPLADVEIRRREHG